MSSLKADNNFTHDSHVTIAPEFDKRISTVQPCSMIVVSILKLIYRCRLKLFLEDKYSIDNKRKKNWKFQFSLREKGGKIK